MASHEANTTFIKHLSTISAWSTAATGVPSVLKLVDLQGYPGIGMASATARRPANAAMRYSNGVRAALAIRTSSGATARNVNISYTSQDSTAGRTLPGTRGLHGISQCAAHLP